MEIRTKFLLVALFVSFVIWIGLFCGLNVPEMKRNTHFFKTRCFVNGSTIIRRYCPVKTCPSTCASTSASGCSFVTNQIKSMNPNGCGPNTTACATPQTCDDGHYCCETHCTRYKDSDGHWHSNCYCVSDTDHHACTIDPRLCYTVRLFLQYNTTEEQQVRTSYDFDTGANGDEAYDIQLYKYQVGHTYSCFYDANNLAVIRWSIAYTVGFWVASGFFALFTFCFCCASCASGIDDTGGNNTIGQMTNVWFWCGFVLGMCLFLPLGLDPHIPATARVHLLRMAIVWTTLTTCAYFIWLGMYTGAFANMWDVCKTCFHAVSEYWYRFRNWFWQQWAALHEWGRTVVDVQCQAFFCGCCNWCSETLRYVAKDGERSEELPPPSSPPEDALSALPLDLPLGRPPTYRSPDFIPPSPPPPMTFKEKVKRLCWNSRSGS